MIMATAALALAAAGAVPPLRGPCRKVNKSRIIHAMNGFPFLRASPRRRLSFSP